MALGAVTQVLSAQAELWSQAVLSTRAESESGLAVVPAVQGRSGTARTLVRVRLQAPVRVPGKASW